MDDNKLKESWSIQGEEKEKYLSQLNSALERVVKDFLQERNGEFPNAVKSFGEKEGWNWGRLPKQHTTYSELAQLADKIRHEYQWFSWISSSEDAAKNRGYFKEIGISAFSGLPWCFDFIELSRLKKNCDNHLKKIPSYEDASRQLSALLLQDYIKISEVPQKAQKIHLSALQRNFFEQLQNTELLGWSKTQYAKPAVHKLLSLGAESLWNIANLTYSMAISMFQIYSIDVWQDIREPVINENDNELVVSPHLKSLLNFSWDNDAWYILKTIDETFSSLHPVHVSRALIGPFENKYQTNAKHLKQLPITGQLISEDPAAGLLRVTLQHAYAPNHRTYEGEYQQIIYREDWRDEIIVAPAQHSTKVSKALLGTSIRILEM